MLLGRNRVKKRDMREEWEERKRGREKRKKLRAVILLMPGDAERETERDNFKGSSEKRVREREREGKRNYFARKTSMTVYKRLNLNVNEMHASVAAFRSVCA